MNDLYLKFLSERSEHTLKLDLTAQRLLEIIASCARYEPLTVIEAISISELASQATLFKRLKQLRHQNLVFDKMHGDDKRTKYLYPTRKAILHFDALGLAMQRTVFKQQAMEKIL